MGIIDVTFACSFDDSDEYCTYDNPIQIENFAIGYSLMFIESKEDNKNNSTSFRNIEDLVERVISHETIHVVIKSLEGTETSDKLDDLEIPFPIGIGKIHLIRMNYLGYADDNTGLVSSIL